MAEGKVESVEFYGDGSGANFTYEGKDHGIPCTWSTSLNAKDAWKALGGFRLKSHEIPEYDYNINRKEA